MLWDAFPAPEGADAGFAVAVTDDSLLPWVMPGETVLLRRNTELSDGDVGLLKRTPGWFSGSSAPTAGARSISWLSTAAMRRTIASSRRKRRRLSSATGGRCSGGAFRCQWIEFLPLCAIIDYSLFSLVLWKGVLF